MVLRFILALCCLANFTGLAAAFDLQGHRGARGLMPENTLPAFAKALSIGVTTLELDTGVTKDGVVVVTHDARLNLDISKDADGSWLSETVSIQDITFSELQAFDVGQIKPGSRTAERFPNQVAVPGTAIPSLEQVFELAQAAGNKSVRFNIETKINPLKPDATIDPEGFAKALLAVIGEHKMESRVSVQSFDWRTLQIVQEINPDIETVYLTAQQKWLDNVASSEGASSVWTAGYNIEDHANSVPDLIKAAGGKVWSPFFGDLNQAKINTAKSLGLRVIPWTVNRQQDMLDLINLGVDGIITDYPDILREVMQSMQLPLPDPSPIDG